MKLIDFIICDDIRTEINNKVSLIGVYNDTLNFLVPERAANIWPKAIQLGLFIRLGLENSEEQKKIKKLSLDYTIEEKTFFHAEQIVDTNDKAPSPHKRMVISVVFNQILIPMAGDMNISLTIIGKDEELIKKITHPGNIKVTVISQK